MQYIEYWLFAIQITEKRERYEFQKFNFTDRPL